MEKLLPLETLTSEQKDQLILKLYGIIQELEKEVSELKKEVNNLKKEVNDLKNQLNKNSRNSHQPPSSDGFKRQTNQRPKSGKPTGAQKGHVGRTLTESNNPDRIIEHRLKHCPHCQFNLADEMTLTWKKAQIYDIPELKIEVEEHLIEEKFCPHCHKLCKACLPKGIEFGVHYGKRIKALMVYLRGYHFIASKRCVEFMQDLFNHTISEGSLFNAEKICYKGLEEFEKRLKKSLKKSSLMHADETGLRVAKQGHWLHVLSNRFGSYFFIHKKRGQQAMQEMNILTHFKGTLVHDHFKPYFKYGFAHALCNAHHLRELQSVFEQTGHNWALKMQSLLRTIKKAVEKTSLNLSTVHAFEKEYDHILYLGYFQQKQRAPPVISRPKEICLLDRLRNYKVQTLLFMHQEDVPFDNNQAERDIRMMKVKMKVSGCFRSLHWPKIFCRIRSYIATIKKNGMAVFQSLVDVFNSPTSNFFSSIQFS